MKVLNLYAGIGGNRKLWKNVTVTAIEDNPEIASIYKDFFPTDEIITTDAHRYLLENYGDYDFIWSSPPCQTHSSFRFNICVRYRNTPPQYADMRLYQEILFLKHHHKGKWIVENVKPYYKPLIEGRQIQRHIFWANFVISDKKFKQDKIREAQIPQLQKMYGFNLSKYKIKNKRQILRNIVSPELGLHILNCAFKNKQKKLETR
jgi:DNA (cytosine-5)-methyltransferase 1